MDWSDCEFVEVIPGKVSGASLVVGTRVPADFVIESFNTGSSVAEIREDYPRISEQTILRLIRFAEERRAASAA